MGGGGLATVVGALLDIPSITFSAPGLTATSAILDPTPAVKKLRHQGINVSPHSDIVPQVDQQSGSNLRIDCILEPLKCHSLGSTMCELLASCGDGGGRPIPRGYRRSCDACGPSGQSYDKPQEAICSGEDELQSAVSLEV